MATYSKGMPGELSEIRDFINMVFSMHRTPHDFGSLLPKLYEDGRSTEKFHYLARENGKLKAVICVLPFFLKHGELTLPCTAIGSVSVHPCSRGKGYMKDLMTWMKEDMGRQGIALSVLDGRRQRYQYFGYEPGGQNLEFQLIPDNFRHCSGLFSSFPISLQAVGKEDTGLLAQCLRLHQTQTVYAQRDETDFHQICRSWNNTLYAVLEGNTVKGCLCASKDHIYELVLENEEQLFSCLNAYMEQSATEQLILHVPSWHSERIRCISSFCERFSIHQEANFCIPDYKSVLSFFLNVKATQHSLTDGSLVIRPGEQPPLRITVQNGAVEVREDKESPCVELSSGDAVNLLFSPGAYLPCGLPSLPASVNWFPLPLSLSQMDKC